MRFRFCGDLDCPDWVLAEINTLSKMSSIKVKMLCQVVAKYLTGDKFDEEKATKLVSDAKLDEGDMKGCVAALTQIFMSATRYGVEEDVLNNELQQLGLPKEHATALGKVYNENLTLITEILAKRSLRTSILEDVSCAVADIRKQKIELTIKVNDKIEDVMKNEIISMSPEQLELLLTDLKLAREQMKSLPS
ncbi:hypothetical protein RUM44_000764 [Polyplax serrata]|uniref:COMM domain-containing protein 4 n=1 Tax=Polyplax serrata TaxID=468196 RepID=A0ABR1B657_POLSC